MSLLVKARREGRDIVDITPRAAGWRYVGFSAHRFAPGDAMPIERPDDELCIVVLSGVVTVAQRGSRWAHIGERRSLFDDGAPYAVSLPDGAGVSISARSPAEIAVA